MRRTFLAKCTDEKGSYVRCSESRYGVKLAELIAAVRQNDLERVRTILKEEKENPNRIDDNNWSALSHSLHLRLEEMTKLLLRYGAFNSLATIRLFTAIENRDVANVEVALREYADPNARTVAGDTPLLRSIEKACLGCAARLLRAGADANLRSLTGMTPLIYAAAAGEEEISLLLVEYKAEINAIHPQRGTAAYWAAKNNHPHLAYELVGHGALNPYSSQEFSAALAAGDMPLLEIAMHTLVDLNRRDDNGDTPLLHAVVRADTGLAEKLLALGADINAQSAAGYTPLIAAVHNNLFPMVEFCLQKGARLELRHRSGRTALMIAAWRADAQVLEILLSHGAQVNAQDAEGWTSLMFAATSGDKSKVKLLLTAGADAGRMNNAGLTVLDIAKQAENSDLISLLSGNN